MGFGLSIMVAIVPTRETKNIFSSSVGGAAEEHVLQALSSSFVLRYQLRNRN